MKNLKTLCDERDIKLKYLANRLEAMNYEGAQSYTMLKYYLAGKYKAPKDYKKKVAKILSSLPVLFGENKGECVIVTQYDL